MDKTVKITLPGQYVPEVKGMEIELLTLEKIVDNSNEPVQWGSNAGFNKELYRIMYHGRYIDLRITHIGSLVAPEVNNSGLLAEEIERCAFKLKEHINE